MKTQKFVDTVTLHASSGKGGSGSASFRREKFVPRGGLTAAMAVAAGA